MDIEALHLNLDQAIERDDFRAIHELISTATTASPQSAPIAALNAKAWLKIGDRKRAIAECQRALTLDGDHEVFHILARAMMPGSTYRDHLRHLHQLLKPKLYLEIGVARGDTLRLALPQSRVIGIDPAATLPDALLPNETLFCMTSDDFFDTKAAEVIAESKISLAYIDGLHLFEQALNDFINVEKYCDLNSVIVIHDTLPVSETVATRRPRSGFWCGDVWKLLPLFEHYRSDLEIFTVPTFPSGLTIIIQSDSSKSVIPNDLKKLAQEYSYLSYAAYSPEFQKIIKSNSNSLSAIDTKFTL